MLCDAAVVVVLCEAESTEVHWSCTMKGVIDVYYVVRGCLWCRFPWR